MKHRWSAELIRLRFKEHVTLMYRLCYVYVTPALPFLEAYGRPLLGGIYSLYIPGVDVAWWPRPRTFWPPVYLKPPATCTALLKHETLTVEYRKDASISIRTALTLQCFTDRPVLN